MTGAVRSKICNSMVRRTKSISRRCASLDKSNRAPSKAASATNCESFTSEAGSNSGGTKFLGHAFNDAVTDRHQIHGNNARAPGGRDALQSEVAFLCRVAVPGDVHEFQLCGGRQDDAGRTEPLANRGQRVQDGLGLLAPSPSRHWHQRRRAGWRARPA